MEKAHHFEYATVGYDAMVAGRDGVMGHFIETVACWYVEKPFDVPVFDIRGPAPGNRGPICPKLREHETEAWEPPDPCPRCGVGTMERVSLAATVG